MTTGPSIADIDEANQVFWNELCGSTAARALGVTDSSAESLAKFDAWYFQFYPYLESHIPFNALQGKRVLEVGLGYGSVAQRLAATGAQYTGLDIAQGPVQIVKHRLRQHRLSGEVYCGSILECPFKDETFDYVVAIGCYHHTGNVQRALDETYRVLKAGGSATVMVYNAYSYRRWLFWPYQSLCYWLADKLGMGIKSAIASDSERAVYDAAMSGMPAPETVFTSGASFRRMTDAKFVYRTIKRENIGSELFFRVLPRKFLLRALGPFMGLDLYCYLQKKEGYVVPREHTTSI